MFRKILLLALFFAALFILFYPVERSPNLNGTWQVTTFINEDKDIHFTGSASFTTGGITVYGYDNYLFKPYSLKSKIIKDSLHISSDNDSLFTGSYKIVVHSKLIGSGEKASFEHELTLTSVNKKITMVRSEPVNWKTGHNRGQP